MFLCYRVILFDATFFLLLTFHELRINYCALTNNSEKLHTSVHNQMGLGILF